MSVNDPGAGINSGHANGQRLESETRQALVLARNDALGVLLEDDGVAVDDPEKRAASILDEMEALNEYGGPTELIEDNRKFVAEACAKRRALAK